jgi:lipoyl(octanoyl) transferase
MAQSVLMALIEPHGADIFIRDIPEMPGDLFPRPAVIHDRARDPAADEVAGYARRVRSMRLGLIEYSAAYDLQRATHAQRIADQIEDTVLLLEHPPVFTAGRGTQPWERPIDGTPVVDIDRGGRITWHGPGQIVGYPIMKLTAPLDVVAFVRRIEEALILTCAQLGLPTTRVAGRSGVWVADGSRDGDATDRKVAAIGIRVAKRVSLHGFALNCNPDLSWFDRIVPCGLPDAQATSLSAELGREVTAEEALPIVERHLDVLREPDRSRVLSAVGGAQ